MNNLLTYAAATRSNEYSVKVDASNWQMIYSVENQNAIFFKYIEILS